MSGAPVFIRTATRRDLPAIRDLLVETWHATYDPILGHDNVAAISREWHSEEVLTGKLSAPASEFILADDGKMIHGVAFASQMEKTVQLHQMYVRPGSQGRGIGTEMMQELFFCFDSATRMELDVHPDNENAVGFYMAGGFAETGRLEVAGPNGLVIPHIVLARELDA